MVWTYKTEQDRLNLLTENQDALLYQVVRNVETLHNMGLGSKGFINRGDQEGKYL